MKVTDYIIEYFIKEKITDIFGYPGGVICHLIDSASKYSDKIKAHLNYNEQGAAFAACGYAQAANKVGVAYSTSGPGATNLVTGIANAFFDSTPTLFLTGQTDTYASKDNYPVRQRGFQETDIVSIVKPITKWAIRIDNPEDIKICLDKAFYFAKSGNPGPILLDLPADVQRADVDIEKLSGYFSKENINSYSKTNISIIEEALQKSQRPVLLVGNGIKQAQLKEIFVEIINKLNIPAVFSLPAFDLLPFTSENNYGFIGTNGQRYANFVIGKSDLIISLGNRLDIRQIGLKRETFAPQARLIRIDIDKEQLSYKVNQEEITIQADLKNLLPTFKNMNFSQNKWEKWLSVCKKLKKELMNYDIKDYHKLLAEFGKLIPDDTNITFDVGQNQIWLAQYLQIKEKQSDFMSAGHGAMGYSLPSAIGVWYATQKPVFCFVGDGGLMMNLQELQFISREKLPIKIICINNCALGMIRGFQERNFNKNYQQTTVNSGYTVPNLEKLSSVFNFKYKKIEKIEQIDKNLINENDFIEILINSETLLEPNFGKNGVIQDQIPYLDRELYNKYMEL